MNEKNSNRNGEEYKGEGAQEQQEEMKDELFEAPEQEVIRLRSELEAKTKEAEENYNKFLRSVADLDNYRKRAEKEKADAISYANESIMEDILPVVDNFERALVHANSEQNVESLRQGVQLIIDQMYAVLKKFGLQEIKSVGGKFDPSLHHAISQEESEAEPDSVVKEFQKGYLLKGRLLRPAMVAVAKKPETH
ncbi:MAG: nucleotide exchange factor GrpE [Deltaproteobacteria bacterium]|nr:nucleotide exchange factor GrpE [Deltaproteobacteria bacterium]